MRIVIAVGISLAVISVLQRHLAFLVNVYATSCRIMDISLPASFNPPATMETHAS